MSFFFPFFLSYFFWFRFSVLDVSSLLSKLMAVVASKDDSNKLAYAIVGK